MDLGLGQNGYGGLSQVVCPTLTPNPSPSRERGTIDPLELIAAGNMSFADIASNGTIHSMMQLPTSGCVGKAARATLFAAYTRGRRSALLNMRPI